MRAVADLESDIGEVVDGLTELADRSGGSHYCLSVSALIFIGWIGVPWFFSLELSTEVNWTDQAGCLMNSEDPGA